MSSTSTDHGDGSTGKQDSAIDSTGGGTWRRRLLVPAVGLAGVALVRRLRAGKGDTDDAAESPRAGADEATGGRPAGRKLALTAGAAALLVFLGRRIRS